MKLVYILSIFLFSASLLGAELSHVPVRADAAVLMDATTGAVLYDKNCHAKRFPASTTKTAAAIYALEKLGESHMNVVVKPSREAIGSIKTSERINSNFTINPHWLEIGGTHMGIKFGEELTIENLFYGMMLISANDAANMIAEYASGNITQFVKEMNDYLQKIGCKDTHFVNVHGHHHPQHYSTPYDMALLTREGLKNPTFRKIISTVTYKRPDTNMQKGVTMVQSNMLLRKSNSHYYSRAIGVKTGSGAGARDTLVAAAEHDGRTLIAVLMNTELRKYNFEDAKRLFEAAFSEKKVARQLITAGPQKYSLSLAGATKPVETYAPSGFTIEYYPSEKQPIQAFLQWNQNLELPIEKDTIVGEIILKNGPKTLVTVPLHAKERVTSQLNQSLWIGGPVLLLLTLIGTIYYFRRKA